jgi:hypothetical protein
MRSLFPEMNKHLSIDLMKQLSCPIYSGVVELLASNSGGDVDQEHQSQ